MENDMIEVALPSDDYLSDERWVFSCSTNGGGTEIRLRLSRYERRSRLSIRHKMKATDAWDAYDSRGSSIAAADVPVPPRVWSDAMTSVTFVAVPPTGDVFPLPP